MLTNVSKCGIIRITAKPRATLAKLNNLRYRNAKRNHIERDILVVREYYDYQRGRDIERILDEMDKRRSTCCSPEKHLERGRYVRSELVIEILRGDYNEYLSDYWEYLSEYDDKWE